TRMLLANLRAAVAGEDRCALAVFVSVDELGRRIEPGDDDICRKRLNQVRDLFAEGVSRVAAGPHLGASRRRSRGARRGSAGALRAVRRTAQDRAAGAPRV